MTNCAPIALFVYNRPEHTRRTLEALAVNSLASESHLFIYSDGPKNHSSVDAVEKVRDVLRVVKGFKTVTVQERSTNLGLAANIIDGVTNLCDRYGRVIVLEDDLLTGPGFLTYMNQALDRYVNDEIVMQISGHSYLDRNSDDQCFLLPHPTSWGWAVWKRAWDRFDPKNSGSSILDKNKKLRHKFNLDGAYPYYGILQKQLEGRVNSWAISWYLTTFLAGGLTVYPPKSLVSNIGFDGSGTHCDDRNEPKDTIAQTMQDTYIFPDPVADASAYSMMKATVRKRSKPKHGVRRLLMHYVRLAVDRIRSSIYA